MGLSAALLTQIFLGLISPARMHVARALVGAFPFQFGLKGFDGGFAILGAIGMKALAGSNAGALYADADPPTDFVCVKVLVECTHLGDFVG